MRRSEIREHVFKIIFRSEFHTLDEMSEQISLYLSEYPLIDDKDKDYIRSRALNVISKNEEIDEKINEISVGWPVSRLGKSELSILRLAIYEMLYDDEVPTLVAVNEAIELAKMYGSDSAPSFINGLLAKLLENKED